MSRLISFGCSLTYGLGLPDCFIPPDLPGLFPSKYAWPALVANSLGLENINNGRPGASNKRILMEVLSFPFKQTDTVSILWSFYNRSLIFSDENKIIDILPNFPNQFLPHLPDEYYKIHSDYDLFIQSIHSISHANLFLEQKHIPVYNFYFDATLHSQLSKHPSNLILTFLRREMKIDIALDNMHPGVKSQELVAENILNTIKEKND